MSLIWRVLDRDAVGSLDAYTAMGGGAAVRVARESRPEDVIDLLTSSGLRGRGGAGFPTGTKWRTIAASRSRTEPTTMVVNAAEGEPGTFKDRALLRSNPYRVLEGAIVAAIVMDTDRIRVGIKSTFGREIQRLDVAIGQMRAAGWLDDLDVELVLGPSAYLFGEETALLEVLEGRQPFPRVTPPYRRGLQPDDTRSAVGVPLASIGGSAGAPALVDNVETLADVTLIAAHGAEWFREHGTEASPGTIVCTVSGATRRSGVGEFAMGSTLRDVIEQVGWGPRAGRRIQAVLAGTSNPLIPADLLDTALTYEAMRDAGSGLGSAGFIVFDDTTEPAAIAAGVSRFLAVESCGQCEPCKADGLFLAEQLRRTLGRGPSAPELVALRHRIGTVTDGARCNLAQQQAAVVGSLLELFPTGAVEGSRTSVEPVTIAPIVELLGGRAVIDVRQASKQPDWSYDDADSGASPAARLGNVPVRIEAPVRSPTESEWRVAPPTDDALAIVDEAHDAIDRLIALALSADRPSLERRVADVVDAVSTHIDVAERILYPMVRRVGDEEGDVLADAAEAQAMGLSGLLAHLDPTDPHQGLRDLAVELHAHADVGGEILAILRSRLDPIDRSSLADGIAAARATSTVSRLRRSASRRQFDRIEPVLPERPAVRPATEVRSEPVHASRSFLVGVDGSPAAAAAVAWAMRLGERMNGEIIVTNLLEPTQAELAPDDYDRLVERAERQLEEEWSEPLQNGSVRHRCLQLTGPPGRLIDAVEAEHADLLIVGTRGHGRSPAAHLGSLAHHLAHHTRGPLAIVPIAGAAAPFDRIVIGLDGSAGSAAAAEWCASIAAACDADVLAVCLSDAIDTEWIALLDSAGVSVRTRVVESAHPADALAAAAEDARAGLLIVGARALGVFERRLVRVPLQLVHREHLPVLMVPEASRA